MRETLTNTKRRDFMWCPRFFFHRHEQQIALIAKKTGRRRGTIFGDALQTARDWQQADATWDEQDSPTEDDDAELLLKYHSVEDAALGSLVESYEAIDPRSQEEATEMDVEHVKLQVMTLGYIKRYGLRPRREVEFYLPLRHPRTGGVSRTFQRGGKLDGLDVTGPQRALIIEDKLVASIQKAMIDRLPLDLQNSEYVDALVEKGWKAEVSFRHTRMPGIEPIPFKQFKTKTRPAETLEEYHDRLTADVQERADWYFDEQRLVFPTDHLEEYRAERWGVARMIMNARLAAQDDWREAYPKNPTRCWEYGGCEYIPICTKQPDAIHRYERVADNVELSGGQDDGETA